MVVFKLLLLLAGLAGAQTTIPLRVKDTPTSEDLEYLDQQIRKNKAAAFDSTVSSTFTAPVAFNSSVTFNGGVFGTINASTFSVNLPAAMTTTNTSFSTCFNSTLTITTNGGSALMFWIAGTARNDTAGGVDYLTILQDGGFLPGGYNATATNGIWSQITSNSAADYSLATTLFAAAPAAGAHSYCLAGATVTPQTMTLNPASHVMRWGIAEFR